MRETVWIESNGQKMLGLLEFDKLEDRGKNLVVLIHGFVGTKVEPHRMYKKLSDRLCKLGYTVLRFDFVGSGDSDGDYKDMTINREIQDGLNVIKFCYESYNVNNIYILGYSMGGCIATIIASTIKSDGLVLWSPVSNPFWNFHHIFGDENLRLGLKGNDVDFLGDIVGKDFFSELSSIDPIEFSKDYKKHVLIVHGTKDQDVFPINAVNYNTAFQDSELYFIDGADHTYSSAEFESKLLIATENYFKDYK
ncbi:MAG: alpha/beta hydrolase family protein [Sedimentibacter sp.]